MSGISSVIRRLFRAIDYDALYASPHRLQFQSELFLQRGENRRTSRVRWWRAGRAELAGETGFRRIFERVVVLSGQPRLILDRPAKPIRKKVREHLHRTGTPHDSV